MMHIKTNLLMEYLDRQLSDSQRKDVEDHVAQCNACHARLVELGRVHESVSARFADLHDDPSPALTDAARTRVLERITANMEITNMSTSVFSRKYRPVWASLMVIAVVVVVLTVPPVRALADRFLQLFRAQEVRTVYVDTDQMKQQIDKLRSSTNLEQLLASTVQVKRQGEPEPIESMTAAGIEAGIQIRLPKSLGEPAKSVLTPASEVNLQIDIERVQAIVADLGHPDIELPASLDGANVKVSVPNGVVTFYGDCGSEGTSPEEINQEVNRSRNCTVLSQIMSPTVAAPAGLDLNRTAAAMLQVLGMSKEEAAEFASSVDWTTTLVMPIPRRVSSAETVMVDGVKGTFVKQMGQQDKPGYILVWIKDETIYSLRGFGSKDEALAIAASM